MAGTWQMDNCCGCEGNCTTVTACPPCLDCFQTNVPQVKCAVPVVITHQNSQDFGWYKPGKFYVVYCGGSWNYRNGWMVTRFPAAADQWNSGAAIFVWWGATGHLGFFNEVQPPGDGYATPALAEAAAEGIYVEIAHPGGHIGLTFTDQRYDDNFGPTAPDTRPLFALYGRGFDLDEALMPMGSCGIDNGDGTYTLNVGLKNISDVKLTELSVQLTGSGFTVHNNPQGPFWLDPGATIYVPFNVTLSGGKAVTGHLQVTISDGTVWGLGFDYDFTPTVVVDSIEGIGIDHACSLEQERVGVAFHINGFQPVDPLGYKAQLTLGGDISAVNAPYTCVAQNPVTCYAAGCGVFGGIGGFGFNVVTTATRPASISLQIAWMDGTTVAQTSTYTVPCVWT